MPPIKRHFVFCNGAVNCEGVTENDQDKIYHLDIYDLSDESLIKVKLPNFVQSVYHLPDRILDLLEIAAYVFSADRLISRGAKDALEYHSWSRYLNFTVKVRDFEFWQAEDTKQKLSKALEFTSGDFKYSFSFQPNHSTPPTSLFDREDFSISREEEDVDIILFSGGLDSLSGIIEKLETTDNKICLVSHRSGQPSTAKTQDKIFLALQRDYPNRLNHYKFHCSLRKSRAIEESQRTRAFLYTSIAYALSHAFSADKMYVFENGITTFNFPKRQDMINARASRTTHPKTLALISQLFSDIKASKFSIKTPYLWKTKSDIFELIKKFGQEKLISSAVSCSQAIGDKDATHCGGCSQCVDRKLSAYASHLDEFDDLGIYSFDFINQSFEDEYIKTMVIDYIRQAINFSELNIDFFYTKYLNELTDIVDFMPGQPEEELIEKAWSICSRHGQQIIEAIKRINYIHNDPAKSNTPNSLLDILSKKDYLEQPLKDELDRHLESQLDNERDKPTSPLAKLEKLSAPKPQLTMQTIKIFLASSSELEDDRKEFEIFISRKNKAYIQQGIFLEVVLWEDFLDAMSSTRLQDEYNKAIAECDVFVSLFYSKVGKYTKEEFIKAFGAFQSDGKPLVYTYFKKLVTEVTRADRKKLESLFDFQDELSELGHFQTEYANIEDLKYKFGEQINKFLPKLTGD